MSLLLLFNQPGASVAFDASSSSPGNGTNTVTWSHTTSGTNRVLLVLVNSFFADGEATGVTYDGVAMTLVGRWTSDPRQSIWSLVAPNTGTHNVTVTFAGPATANGFMAAISFTNADQTTPTGTFSTNTATSSNQSVTSSSTDAAGLIASIVGDYGGSVITIASGTTRENRSGGFAQAATQDGGTATTSWTTPSADLWTASAVLVKPAGSAVPITGTLAQTLGAATLVGVASAPATGSLAQTLGAATIVGVGSAPAGGTLSQTLAALTASGTGTVPAQGATAATLGALTGVGVGAVPVVGGLAQTLGAATVAATGGGPSITGTLAVTLGAVSLPLWPDVVLTASSRPQALALPARDVSSPLPARTATLTLPERDTVLVPSSRSTTFTLSR